KPLNVLGALPPSLALPPSPLLPLAVTLLAVPADSLSAALTEALDDSSEALVARHRKS
ncbi:hypothetical protein GMDG_08633, partial [Pseudogymnoascus destructans 20631-21]